MKRLVVMLALCVAGCGAKKPLPVPATQPPPSVPPTPQAPAASSSAYDEARLDFLKELREIRGSASGTLRGGHSFEKVARAFLDANDAPADAWTPQIRALVESLVERSETVLNPDIRRDPQLPMGTFFSDFARDTEQVEDFLVVRSPKLPDRRATFLKLLEMIAKAGQAQRSYQIAIEVVERLRLESLYLESLPGISDAANEAFALHKDLTPREQEALKELIVRTTRKREWDDPMEVKLQDLRDEFQRFADRR